MISHIYILCIDIDIHIVAYLFVFIHLSNYSTFYGTLGNLYQVCLQEGRGWFLESSDFRVRASQRAVPPKKKDVFVTLASPMLPYFSQSGDPRKPTSVWGSCLSRGTSLGFDHQLFRLPMAIEWGIPRWTSPMLWLFLLSELTRGRNHRQWTWLGYLSLSLRRTTQDILPRNRERTDLDGKTSMISCKKKLNSILIGG